MRKTLALTTLMFALVITACSADTQPTATPQIFPTPLPTATPAPTATPQAYPTALPQIATEAENYDADINALLAEIDRAHTEILRLESCQQRIMAEIVTGHSHEYTYIVPHTTDLFTGEATDGGLVRSVSTESDNSTSHSHSIPALELGEATGVTGMAMATLEGCDD